MNLLPLGHTSASVVHILKSESIIMQTYFQHLKRRFQPIINNSKNVFSQKHFNLFNQCEIMIMMDWRTDLADSSAYTEAENLKRNHHYLPTKESISSHFPRIISNRQHYFTETRIILFWFVILACCSPGYVANGLPLAMTGSSPLHSNPEIIFDSSLMLRSGHIAPQRLWRWQVYQDKNKLIQEIGDGGDDDDDADANNAQETAGLGKIDTNVLMMMVVPPRRKKGLSYLTKYYSEAFLNNTPNSSGGSSGANSSAQSHHDSSNHFFGASSGGGLTSSREQRFPSSVRRKLAFTPPMPSHPVFMAPWSRFSSTGHGNGGRSQTMRLRWGR